MNVWRTGLSEHANEEEKIVYTTRPRQESNPQAVSSSVVGELLHQNLRNNFADFRLLSVCADKI